MIADPLMCDECATCIYPDIIAPDEIPDTVVPTKSMFNAGNLLNLEL